MIRRFVTRRKEKKRQKEVPVVSDAEGTESSPDSLPDVWTCGITMKPPSTPETDTSEIGQIDNHGLELELTPQTWATFNQTLPETSTKHKRGDDEEEDDHDDDDEDEEDDSVADLSSDLPLNRSNTIDFVPARNSKRRWKRDSAASVASVASACTFSSESTVKRGNTRSRRPFGFLRYKSKKDESEKKEEKSEIGDQEKDKMKEDFDSVQSPMRDNNGQPLPDSPLLHGSLAKPRKLFNDDSASGAITLPVKAKPSDENDHKVAQDFHAEVGLETKPFHSLITVASEILVPELPQVRPPPSAPRDKEWREKPRKKSFSRQCRQRSLSPEKPLQERTRSRSVSPLRHSTSKLSRTPVYAETTLDKEKKHTETEEEGQEIHLADLHFVAVTEGLFKEKAEQTLNVAEECKPEENQIEEPLSEEAQTKETEESEESLPNDSRPELENVNVLVEAKPKPEQAGEDETEQGTEAVMETIEVNASPFNGDGFVVDRFATQETTNATATVPTAYVTPLSKRAQRRAARIERRLATKQEALAKKETAKREAEAIKERAEAAAREEAAREQAEQEELAFAEAARKELEEAARIEAALKEAEAVEVAKRARDEAIQKDLEEAIRKEREELAEKEAARREAEAAAAQAAKRYREATKAPKFTPKEARKEVAKLRAAMREATKKEAGAKREAEAVAKREDKATAIKETETGAAAAKLKRQNSWNRKVEVAAASVDAILAKQKELQRSRSGASVQELAAATEAEKVAPLDSDYPEAPKRVVSAVSVDSVSISTEGENSESTSSNKPHPPPLPPLPPRPKPSSVSVENHQSLRKQKTRLSSPPRRSSLFDIPKSDKVEESPSRDKSSKMTKLSPGKKSSRAKEPSTPVTVEFDSNEDLAQIARRQLMHRELLSTVLEVLECKEQTLQNIDQEKVMLLSDKPEIDSIPVSDIVGRDISLTPSLVTTEDTRSFWGRPYMSGNGHNEDVDDVSTLTTNRTDLKVTVSKTTSDLGNISRLLSEEAMHILSPKQTVDEDDELSEFTRNRNLDPTTLWSDIAEAFSPIPPHDTQAATGARSLDLSRSADYSRGTKEARDTSSIAAAIKQTKKSLTFFAGPLYPTLDRDDVSLAAESVCSIRKPRRSRMHDEVLDDDSLAMVWDVTAAMPRKKKRSSETSHTKRTADPQMDRMIPYLVAKDLAAQIVSVFSGEEFDESDDHSSAYNDEVDYYTGEDTSLDSQSLESYSQRIIRLRRNRQEDGVRSPDELIVPPSVCPSREKVPPVGKGDSTISSARLTRTFTAATDEEKKDDDIRRISSNPDPTKEAKDRMTHIRSRSTSSQEIVLTLSNDKDDMSTYSRRFKIDTADPRKSEEVIAREIACALSEDNSDTHSVNEKRILKAEFVRNRDDQSVNSGSVGSHSLLTRLRNRHHKLRDDSSAASGGDTATHTSRTLNDESTLVVGADQDNGITLCSPLSALFCNIF